MKRKIVFMSILMAVLCIVIIYCIKSHEKELIVATVNGEPVYQSDLDRVSELGTNITNDEIIELVMKELIVYQEAKNLGFNIEDDVVESRILSLKEEMPELYLLCIEQYGSEEAYKKALSYTILYDMVYDYYAVQYVSNLQYNIDDIIKEAIECNFVSKEEMEEDQGRAIILFLKEKYRNEIRNYFEYWNNDEFKKANIVYK